MKPLLIIKFGPATPLFIERHGNFEDLFIETLEIERSLIEIVDPSEGEDLPDPAPFSGVLLMGSHANVTDRLEWIDSTAAWIRGVVKGGIPLLGVCFGHQLLAHATGGKTDNNPNGREFGTVAISLDEAAKQDRLFTGLPDSFPVHVSHAQSVHELPPGAVHLASSARDPNQAFHLPPCAWGVQFHPEFNAEITYFSIHEFAEPLRSEGQDLDRLLAEVKDAPESILVLKNFKRIIQEKQP